MNPSHFYKEIVGIVGGMGSEATNYFISLLIKNRKDKVTKDQDHIPFLVFNNPQIPDRTEYLVNGINDPLPQLVHTANLLKTSGATFLAMPCNTSHAFLDLIEKEVGIDILNMIDLTANYVMDRYQIGAKVGLLATDGTIASKLYQEAFSSVSSKMTVLLPEEKYQQDVMEAIYSIKSSSVNPYNTRLLYNAATSLIKNGAEIIILGCTEIPLALTKENFLFPHVNTMEILAHEVIQRTLLSALQTEVYSQKHNRTI